MKSVKEVLALVTTKVSKLLASKIKYGSRTYLRSHDGRFFDGHFGYNEVTDSNFIKTLTREYELRELIYKTWGIKPSENISKKRVQNLAAILRNGAGSTTSKEYLEVVGKVWFSTKYNKPAFNFGVHAEDTYIPVEAPAKGLAELFGFNRKDLKVINVDLSTSWLTYDYVKIILEESKIDSNRYHLDGNYNILVDGTRMFEFNKGKAAYHVCVQSLNVELFQAISTLILIAFNRHSKNRAKYYLEVAPSNWIGKRGKDAFNLLVSEFNYTEKVLDILNVVGEEKRKEARIRLSKDFAGSFIRNISKEYLDKGGYMLILPDHAVGGNKDALDNDGNLYLRFSAIIRQGYHALIRGKVKFGNAIGVLKGRAIVSEKLAGTLPDGSPLPEDCIGWTREGQVKYLNLDLSKGPVKVRFFYGMTKDEAYDQKFGYSLTLLSIFNSKLKAEDRMLLLSLAIENMAGHLDEFRNPVQTLMNQILKAVDSEEGSMATNGVIARGLVGMSLDAEEVKAAQCKILSKSSKFRNKLIKRVAGIQAEKVMTNQGFVDIPKGYYIPSVELRKLREKFGTGMDTCFRYPTLDYLSFVPLQMHPTLTLPEEVKGLVAYTYVDVNASMQIDGDDHFNIIINVSSEYIIGSATPIDKHCKTVSLESYNKAGCYIHGFVSQRDTGSYTNTYMHTVANVCWFKGFEYLDEVRDRMIEVIQAIQACVQGAKKAVVPSIAIADARQLGKDILDGYGLYKWEEGMYGRYKSYLVSPIVQIARKRELSEVKQGVEHFLPNAPAGEKVKDLACRISSRSNPVIGYMVKKIESKEFRSVEASRKVVFALADSYGIDLDNPKEADISNIFEVAKDYAYFCSVLKDKKTKYGDVYWRALKNANGVLIFMGVHADELLKEIGSPEEGQPISKEEVSSPVEPTKVRIPAVVRYNGKYYVHYRDTDNGMAKLINQDGSKFSGCPAVNKMEFVKYLKTVEYNGHRYFMTKLGVFSCTSGDKITAPVILEKF